MSLNNLYRGTRRETLGRKSSGIWGFEWKKEQQIPFLWVEQKSWKKVLIFVLFFIVVVLFAFPSCSEMLYLFKIQENLINHNNFLVIRLWVVCKIFKWDKLEFQNWFCSLFYIVFSHRSNSFTESSVLFIQLSPMRGPKSTLFQNVAPHL